MVSTFSQAADTAQNVLLMTIPGLALFYGGLVRTALHTKSQILAHSPPHEAMAFALIRAKMFLPIATA
jgi:ammonia channel protein AmtB